MIVPTYYKKFKCIADQCRHNCCIGWEIDIDPETLARYEGMEGPLGERLKKAVCRGEDAAFFRLEEGERCPFLNPQGLCDIYTELGEGALCAICTDHPRFRNYFTQRVEMGLGLCCEEAARLILNQKDPLTLEELSPEGESLTLEEEAFLAYRETVFARIFDSSLPLAQRVPAPEGAPAQWADFYLGLEQLDPQWAELLQQLKTAPVWVLPTGREKALAQLAAYFIYRHLAEGLWQENIPRREAFARLSLWVIATVSVRAALPLEEVARMYSAEIEYSDENLQRILEWL